MERILIVDDNKDMQFTLSSILKDEGYETIAVGDGTRAISQIKMKSPNLILLDIKLPGINGMKILEEIKKIDSNVIVIMLTAYGDFKDAVKAMKLGAYDYITKPFDNDEMVLTIQKALQTQYLSREVETLRRKLGEQIPLEKVMGESPKIMRVLKLVKIIAPTNMTVILQGESGTGKELIARMIHQGSVRKDKPFVAVDCGAIPETLVESELFGYEKGAFTGANGRKEGEFEQANGGTLFLDEITNLPWAAQVKLLRVIQERKLRHLGGGKDLNVDVRIIVATNTKISEAARAGSFREDLFHRLNEFHIDLPALRERKEDIPILAQDFLQEANRELGRKIKGFSTSAVKSMLNYHWPGNVRELRNVIRKAVLLTDSDYITPTHLSTNTGDPQRGSDLTMTLDEGASLKEITNKVQSDLIRKALEQVGGNKVRAAKILSVNRKALYRKMKSLAM